LNGAKSKNKESEKKTFSIINQRGESHKKKTQKGEKNHWAVPAGMDADRKAWWRHGDG